MEIFHIKRTLRLFIHTGVCTTNKRWCSVQLPDLGVWQWQAVSPLFKLKQLYYITKRDNEGLGEQTQPLTAPASWDKCTHCQACGNVMPSLFQMDKLHILRVKSHLPSTLQLWALQWAPWRALTTHLCANAGFAHLQHSSGGKRQLRAGEEGCAFPALCISRGQHSSGSVVALCSLSWLPSGAFCAVTVAGALPGCSSWLGTPPSTPGAGMGCQEGSRTNPEFPNPWPASLPAGAVPEPCWTYGFSGDVKQMISLGPSSASFFTANNTSVFILYKMPQIWFIWGCF